MNTEKDGTQTVILQLDSKAAATYANAKMIDTALGFITLWVIVGLFVWGIRTLYKNKDL